MSQSPSSTQPDSFPNSESCTRPIDLSSSLIPPLLSSSRHIPIVPSPTMVPLSILEFVSPSSSLPPESISSSPVLDPTLEVSHNVHPMITRSKHSIYKPKVIQVHHDYTIIEPPSFAIATKHPQWVVAMDLKFQSFQKQQTWSLVPLPPHKNVVTCKWVYKLNRHSDGPIVKYKARLVARGYLQQYGLDYDETFSPVVKPTIVRLLLALVVNNNWS